MQSNPGTVAGLFRARLQAVRMHARACAGDVGFGRRLSKDKFSIAAGLICVLSLTARADSVSIAYTALQISGSQWQYNYKLSGSLSAGDDIAVYFPFATSSGLTDLATGGSSWTTLVFAPDLLLPADGEYDMLANVNNPSLTPTFSATFLYSGLATPGSQAFTLFDPNFNVLQAGYTQSANTSSVPEPASIALVSSGFAAIWRVRRRLRSS